MNAIFNQTDSDDQTWRFFLHSKKMEAIGSLAGGLAHDFNNILTSIHASAQLLRMRQEMTEDELEAISDIEGRVICGAELIKQLLMFSKSAHRPQGSAFLNQRIRVLHNLLKRILPKNIQIKLDLIDPELVIKMSVAELEQIFMNLVINARDAMPEGGTIKITSKITKWSEATPSPIPNVANGTYAQIEVSDSGRGIASSKLSKIFDPYFSSKHENGGTGLGLAIVSAIIQRHNGYIMVSSELSVGTIFTIFLPANISQTNKEKVNDVEQESLLGGNETILLVDDEPIILKSTAHFLERYGYQTITASDGKEALKEFKKQKDDIDIVLLDLEIPGANGLSCLNDILSLNPKAKIIIMSGHLISSEAENPITAGARAFLQKPFESDKLLRTIRSIVSKKSK